MDIRRGSHRRILHISTILLIIFAVFGPALPGIGLGGFNIFPFIIYLAIHGFVTLLIMVRSESYTLEIPLPVQLLLLFLLYMILSYFWTVNMRGGFIRLVLILTLAGVTCFIYWSSMTDSIVNRYIAVLEVILLLGIPIAFVEITTGAHLPVSKRYGTVEYFRATAWHGNENDFSNFLAIVSFFFLSRAIYKRSLFDRIGGVTVFALSFVIIYQNDSRAAVIAMISGVILMVGLYVSRQWTNVATISDRTIPLFSVAAIIGLLGTLFVFTLNPNPFSKWSSLWYRWQLHTASIEMLFRTAGRGVGVGGFRTYMGELPILPNRTMPAHSWLANILSELGIVGVLTFLFAYARTLDRLLWNFLQNGERVALGLLVSMTVFLISGLGPSVPLMMQVHWIVWGIALAHLYAK